jgi:hypothetical protein
MVLDAKALTWAGKNDIDTAKLKKAKIPIYGKWYFPEIPPNVPLINLETGEQQVFSDSERMLAGEVIYVPAADLQAAGLAPAGFAVMDVTAPGSATTTRAITAIAPEPLVAMARPPGLPRETEMLVADGQQSLVAEDPAALAGIHMPSASVAPFVMAIGFCLALLGLITNVIIFVTGLLWMLAGAIVWIRIGLLEYRAHHAHVVAEEEHTA